jgi:phytoene dehydrogenase-like protein
MYDEEVRNRDEAYCKVLLGEEARWAAEKKAQEMAEMLRALEQENARLKAELTSAQAQEQLDTVATVKTPSKGGSLKRDAKTPARSADKENGIVARARQAFSPHLGKAGFMSPHMGKEKSADIPSPRPSPLVARQIAA